MRSSRNRGALENYRDESKITIFVLEIHGYGVGAGSVIIQLNSGFARGTWRKDFDSYSTCTFCDQTDICGNLDSGVDDARLFAFLIEVHGEGAIGACVSEREVEIEKCNQKERRHGGCGLIFRGSMMKKSWRAIVFNTYHKAHREQCANISRRVVSLKTPPCCCMSKAQCDIRLHVLAPSA